MGASWYVEKGGKRSGPFTPAQLKELVASGRLDPTDMVQNDGMEKAILAGKVKGLFPADVGLPASPVAGSQWWSAAPVQNSPKTAAVPGDPVKQATSDPPPVPIRGPVSPSLYERFSRLPGWKKGVAALGVLLIGSFMFSCVAGVIMTLAGVKPSSAKASKNEEGKGNTTQGASKEGKAVIKHDPYTQVVMPTLPPSRIHEVGAKDKSQYGKPKSVRVADIAQIDFTQGPDGEPIEMDRAKWQDGVLRTESYFYRDKEERKVFHGPLTSFDPRGNKQSETVYVFGIAKFGQHFEKGQNLVPEIYRGDDDHKCVTYTLYDNKSLKSVLPYYVRHHTPELTDRVDAVNHGRELIFWDNTVLMANIKMGAVELSKDIGGVRTEYTWEHGKRVRRREFKRSGEMYYEGQ